MTDKQFRDIFTDALKQNDRDAFVSNWALSTTWGDAPEDDIPADQLEKLGEIWDAAHRSARDIAAAAGLSQRKLAERFCIKYRTMENWCGGVSDCPVHTRLMMQECLGLIHK